MSDRDSRVDLSEEKRRRDEQARRLRDQPGTKRGMGP